MAFQQDLPKDNHKKEMAPKAFLPSSEEDRHHRRRQDHHRHSWNRDPEDVVHHLATALEYLEVKVKVNLKEDLKVNDVGHMVHQWDLRRWDHHHRKKEVINEQLIDWQWEMNKNEWIKFDQIHWEIHKKLIMIVIIK